MIVVSGSKGPLEKANRKPSATAPTDFNARDDDLGLGFFPFEPGPAQVERKVEYPATELVEQPERERLLDPLGVGEDELIGVRQIAVLSEGIERSLASGRRVEPSRDDLDADWLSPFPPSSLSGPEGNRSSKPRR